MYTLNLLKSAKSSGAVTASLAMVAVAGNIAYRSSDYSSSGRVEAWKMGLEFNLFEDLRIRATKSRDVREVSFAERFDGAPAVPMLMPPSEVVTG